MKLKTSTLSLITIALTGAALSAQADVTLGVNFTGGYLTNPSPSYGVGNFANNLGYEFQVIAPITVSGLAAFNDAGLPGSTVYNPTYSNPGPGLSQAVAVGLWTYGLTAPTAGTPGTEIASATIAQGTASLPGTLFAGTTIAPVTLSPGYYIVAANDDWVQQVGAGQLTDFTVNPNLDFVGYAYGNSPTGNPTQNIGPEEALFGGNILVQAPEPGQTVGLGMLLSCGGLFYGGRRMLKNRRAAASN